MISDFDPILTSKNPICRKRQEPLKRLRLGSGTVAVFTLAIKPYGKKVFRLLLNLQLF